VTTSGDAVATDAPGADAVVLVAMNGSHLPRVVEIEQQTSDTPWSEAMFTSELTMRSTRAYTVALVDGEVAGYAGVMMNGDEGHITTVAVDPAYRRRHVATRLLLQCAHEALRRRGRSMTLEVRVSNTAARNLYVRFGYAPVGLRRNYYPKTREDALIMTVDDVDTEDYARRLGAIAATVASTTWVVQEPLS
jgi:ribosomal-protein-alanine N-acetyltransferase